MLSFFQNSLFREMENGVSRSSLVHGTQTNPNSDTWYDTDAFLLVSVLTLTLIVTPPNLPIHYQFLKSFHIPFSFSIQFRTTASSSTRRESPSRYQIHIVLSGKHLLSRSTLHYFEAHCISKLFSSCARFHLMAEV